MPDDLFILMYKTYSKRSVLSLLFVSLPSLSVDLYLSVFLCVYLFCHFSMEMMLVKRDFFFFFFAAEKCISTVRNIM